MEETTRTEPPTVMAAPEHNISETVMNDNDNDNEKGTVTASRKINQRRGARPLSIFRCQKLFYRDFDKRKYNFIVHKEICEYF